MSNPVWPMLAAERAALVDTPPLLPTPDRDWPNRGVPVRGWTARHCAVAGAKTTPLTFGPSLIRSGFSFDRLGARGIRQQAAATPAELIAALRARIDAKTMPGSAYLGEVVVHGEDIRRGVGAPPGEHPTAHLTAVADYYKKSGAPVGGKQRIAGLKLSATDVEWTTGAGPEVEGPLVLVVMAICGRRFAIEELKGPGQETLAARA